MANKKKKTWTPFNNAQFERNLREDCARNEANIRAMLSSKLPPSSNLLDNDAPGPASVQSLFKFRD